MEVKTVYVDKIHSGCCERGIFRFLCNDKLIDCFNSFYPANNQYDWPHHLEYPDIIKLNQTYPEEIPLCEQNFDLTSWGERVKYGLYTLVVRGVFDRVLVENGREVNLNFMWVGPSLNKRPIRLIKNPRKQPAGLR